jgi:hypothetical protein
MKLARGISEVADNGAVRRRAATKEVKGWA